MIVMTQMCWNIMPADCKEIGAYGHCGFKVIVILGSEVGLV